MTGHRRAAIRVDREHAGVLEELPGDRYMFTYDAAWLTRGDAVPVSLTMPLRAAPYESQGLHPAFENLLPEGWLFDVATAALHISKNDPFGLLLATCRDCVGAVEVIPVEDAP